MEKKLTSQGPKKRQSYTVTLPKEWVLKQGLDKTKEIEMELVGNKIVLSKEKKSDKMVELNEEDYKKSLIKALQGLYRTGINEIKVNYTSEQYLERIIDILNRKLIGYEIVEQKKNTVIIKYIVSESEEDFRIVLRRIFLLLLELPETTSIIKIRSLKYNISRLFNYCERILITKGHLEYLKSPFYYLLLDILDKLSDEYLWLGEVKTLNKKEIEYKKRLVVYLNNAYNLFYKFDKSGFDELVEGTFQMKNELRDLIDSRACLHLHNIARLTNSLAGITFCIDFRE